MKILMSARARRLGDIHYMDALVNGIDGTPVKIENAICIHEEDQGLGWKH